MAEDELTGVDQTSWLKMSGRSNIMAEDKLAGVDQTSWLKIS